MDYIFVAGVFFATVRFPAFAALRRRSARPRAPHDVKNPRIMCSVSPQMSEDNVEYPIQNRRHSAVFGDLRLLGMVAVGGNGGRVAGFFKG